MFASVTFPYFHALVDVSLVLGHSLMSLASFISGRIKAGAIFAAMVGGRLIMHLVNPELPANDAAYGHFILLYSLVSVLVARWLAGGKSIAEDCG